MKKEELKDLIAAKKFKNMNVISDYHAGQDSAYEEVYNLIDQLDEPEVLSQKWISENKEMYLINDTSENAVPAYKLQNLLLPKQELPVIPKFVAEWLEKTKTSNILTSTFPIWQSDMDEECTRMSKWMDKEGNSELFARAWLDGYTVEEEPLYRARLKVISDEFIASYLRTQSSDAEDRLKALEIGSKYIHEDYRHLSEFTEDELKRLNIWDSEQWEVEELEE